MERIHTIGTPAMIIAVWVLSAWTAMAMSVAQPIMYGPPVYISAQAVHHLEPERGQASRSTR
jgi:hypothetical protein